MSAHQPEPRTAGNFAAEAPREPVHRVMVQPAGISVLAQSGEPIIEALRRAGYRTRYKCRRGGCGVCRATLLSGSVTYQTAVCHHVVTGSDTPESEPEDGPSSCLPCRAVPESDVELELGTGDRIVRLFGALEQPGRPAMFADVSATVSHERNQECQY